MFSPFSYRIGPAPIGLAASNGTTWDTILCPPGCSCGGETAKLAAISVLRVCSRLPTPNTGADVVSGRHSNVSRRSKPPSSRNAKEPSSRKAAWKKLDTVAVCNCGDDTCSIGLVKLIDRTGTPSCGDDTCSAGLVKLIVRPNVGMPICGDETCSAVLARLRPYVGTPI